IEYMRTQMSAEEAAVRIDGKDGAAFGVVYKQFDPERHVLKPFDLPPDAPRWRAMDYGYRNPTAVLWVAVLPPDYVLPDGRVLPSGALVVYREMYVTERTVPQNAAEIIGLSAGESYVGLPIIDPTAA